MPFFSRFASYFEEVVRQGSIRKAAERLNVAASAIDRQMLNAEEMLGVPLFERMPNGLRLTATGELAIHYLRRWNAEHRRLRQQIQELKGARRGEVVVAVPDGLASGFMPQAIMRIRHTMPRMSFRVTVAVAETVASLVRSGDCDFGLTFDPVSFEGLTVEYALPSRLGILAPADHPLCAHDRVRLSECVPYPVVVPDRTTALWRLIAAVIQERRTPLEMVFTSNNVAVLSEMVVQGLGIGLMRDLDALVHRRDPSLRFVPFLDAGLATQRLSLIVARGRRLSVAAELLLQHLKLLMQEFLPVEDAA